MINRFIEKISRYPRQLFLVDCLGAILTASLLAFVVAPFESVFGLPHLIAYKLATVAIFLALYSAINYKFFGKKWSRWLRIIAIANTLYCLATMVVVVMNWQVITLLGIVYFIGEAAIVARLVMLEWKVAAR